MSRPIVGIIGNPHMINSEYLVHGAGEMNAWAVREVCDALPVIIPPDAMLAPVVDLMEACDGFVFTGGRPNVHPKNMVRPSPMVMGIRMRRATHWLCL